MSNPIEKSPVLKSGGFISRTGIWTGKQVLGPYIHAGKTLSGSMSRISSSFKELFRRFRRPGTIDHDAYLWSQARDAKAAFEELYASNKWTEKGLINQRKAIRRTKFAMILMVWILFCLTLSSVFYIGSVFLFFAIPAGVCMIFIAGIRAFQFALFEAQLDDRTLFTFNQFISREDLFSRIFT
jgi:hypothetical protein